LATEAAATYRPRYYGLESWREFGLLARLLGAHGTNHGELLSFLMFEPDFLSRALELGRADATALLATDDPDEDQDDLPWRTAPPPGMAGHRSHSSRATAITGQWLPDQEPAP
jgi:NTE family protein